MYTKVRGLPLHPVFQYKHQVFTFSRSHVDQFCVFGGGKRTHVAVAVNQDSAGQNDIPAFEFCLCQ